MRRRPRSKCISCRPAKNPPAWASRVSPRSAPPSPMRYLPQPASVCAHFLSPRAILRGADAMNATPGKKARPILWIFLGLVVIGAAAAAYIVFGPQPTGFAGGKRVALGDYAQGDPTGVPAE